VADPSIDKTEHPLPTQFGRYRILDRLATGGMANLFLARFAGPDGFEKLVAIKQIHEHLTTQEDFVSMFKDEARLAARIAHPNVAQVLELGQVDNLYFITMEYVEGESLTELIKRTEIPHPVVARIIADALAGLHAAHELRNTQGELLHVVHRDLSPSNILISYEGAVKVVDFGVAKARDNLNITDAGTVKGKFAYMAPEQVQDGPVDRRADVFAAGILLFEATTRRNLFKADTPAGSVSKIVKGQVPPPSKVIPGYPPELEAVVMKALKVDPAERYQTAKAMQEELEEFIFTSGAPVMTARVGELMRKVFADRFRMKKQMLREKTMPGVGTHGTSGPQKPVTIEVEAVGLSDRPPTQPRVPAEVVVPTPEAAEEAKPAEDKPAEVKPEKAPGIKLPISLKDIYGKKKPAEKKEPTARKPASLPPPVPPPIPRPGGPGPVEAKPAEAEDKPAEDKPAEDKPPIQPTPDGETPATEPLSFEPSAGEPPPPSTPAPQAAPLPDIPSAGARLSKPVQLPDLSGAPMQGEQGAMEEVDLVDVLGQRERRRKLMLAGGGGLVVLVLLIITIVALSSGPKETTGGDTREADAAARVAAKRPDARIAPDLLVPDGAAPDQALTPDSAPPDLGAPDLPRPDLKATQPQPKTKQHVVRPHPKTKKPQPKTKKGLFGNPY